MALVPFFFFLLYGFDLYCLCDSQEFPKSHSMACTYVPTSGHLKVLVFRINIDRCIAKWTLLLILGCQISFFSLRAGLQGSC